MITKRIGEKEEDEKNEEEEKEGLFILRRGKKTKMEGEKRMNGK